MRYQTYTKKTLIIILLCIVPNLLSANSDHIFKLSFINEDGQTAKLFLGADKNATDDYDSDMTFPVADTLVQETLDLPPFPFSMMDCRIIRDTNDMYNTYSYTDIRSLPENGTMHKYRIEIRWWVTSTTPFVNIEWGILPKGIDSAKIRCWQWLDEWPDIDMKENEELLLSNSSHKTLFVSVWYNGETSISDNANNKIEWKIIDNNLIVETQEEFNKYSICNIAGQTMLNDKLENKQTPTIININKLNRGYYFLSLEASSGKKTAFSFIY